MNGLTAFFRRLFAAEQPPEERLRGALFRCHDDAADPLYLLRGLFAACRPHSRSEAQAGLPAAQLQRLLQLLQADAGLRTALARQVGRLVGERRLLTFFTDSGILPGTGFFSEGWRIVGNRLLPEVPDERRLKDCLHVLCDHGDDWRWLETLPSDDLQRLWQLLDAADAPPLAGVREQMLDAILLLAHRVSGLGVEGELMRASPNLDADRPRFVALSAEALAFAQSWRQALHDPEYLADDGSQLLVLSAQCRETLQRIRRRALQVGASQSLSYLLTRSQQSLERLETLVGILAPPPAADALTPPAAAAWSDFVHSALLAENRRNSLRHYLGELSHLLAVRVTENAAHSGEHYICEEGADYRRMWASAAGAGVLIGGMALLKILAAGLHAPLFVEAVLFSLIYGGGFVLIYLLGLTVATKQPAMTAQTLAGLLGDLKPNRAADLERLVDVVAAVSRSQLAAIAGNVMVALPVAIAIGCLSAQALGAPAVTMEKGAHLLADLDPLGWALPHAAVAGFYLFLSGLITGFFDNRATYQNIGPRLSRLRWLRILLGDALAARFGSYVQDKLGGIMGNLLFGCMLGSTGVFGQILGLPLDIRHIAFSSANLGYALTAFDFALAAPALAWAALGVALIGAINLGVSFTLALRTALAARRIRFTHWGPLLRAIACRLRHQPRSFLLPPAAGKD
ncbi:preprotein translocase subunit TatB [Dechloromonas sp. ZY10]|uniref:site-specific recombinase n=1 Tax=Dechloromonas aquae TaxID=2664436 RepID=UPI003529112A